MNTPYYYYTLLDIPLDASLPEIKKAYRKKALQYHPDKCRDPASADTFKEVNQAFQVLSDADKRRSYDACGGFERAEIPITLSRPFEDFCEGVALGSFSLIANVAGMAVFGVPAGFSYSGVIFFTQLFTAWQFAPSSIDEARELRNWFTAIGAVVAPLFLLTSAGCAAGYALASGGKLALEYTSTKMGEIGSSLSDLGSQVKNSVKALQSHSPKENLSVALDDWVVLEEDTKRKKKPLSICEPKIEAPPKVEEKKPDAPSFDQSEDWVLVDDLL